MVVTDERVRARGDGGGGGRSSSSQIDGLERENDRSISHMSDRVSALKQITVDIHDEVEGHHRLINDTSDDMARMKTALRESAMAFQQVIDNARKAGYFWKVVGGMVFGFFFLRWLL